MNSPAGQKEERWIILFDSIHQVIAVEEVFKTTGVWCDLKPVPKDLSSDCGMAIEFRRCDLAAVRQVLSASQTRPRSIHRPGPRGHVEVTTAEGGGCLERPNGPQP